MFSSSGEGMGDTYLLGLLERAASGPLGVLQRANLHNWIWTVGSLIKN
jgi:hypothetical protein